METNIGIWRVYLEDDGTLDTVVTAEMRIQPRYRYTSRFSSSSDHRDNDGYLTDEGFAELAEDAADHASECHELTREAMP